jgi:nucleotide-binding universal stress UspA family protein
MAAVTYRILRCRFPGCLRQGWLKGLRNLSHGVAMFRKIMVALDESPEADRALRVAIRLATDLVAELAVVTVIEPPPAYFSFAVSADLICRWREEKRRFYTSLQTRARQRARAAGLWLDTDLVDGDEVGSIVECARSYGADLLVLGMPRHRFSIGHTGKAIAESSPCPLLGVR